MYNKFSCYEKGYIERKTKPLKDLSHTYFTVEDIKSKKVEDKNDFELDMQENDKLKLKTLEPILKKIFKDKFNINFEANEQKRINMLINLDRKITVNEKILINSKIKKEYFHVEIILEKENTFIHVYPKNITYIEKNDEI